MVELYERGIICTERVSNIAKPQLNNNKMILPSATKNIEAVWEWLSDEDVTVIVINGKSGSGKTWTAKNIMDRANASNLFDLVIWVDLADNVLPDEMLHIILVQLNLCGAESENEDVSREKLRREISITLAEKRYLLILDGISSLASYNLESMGIPFPREQRRSSKVLVTGPKSLTKYIVADKVHELNRFLKDEAWLLFQKISGSDVDSPHRRKLLNPWLEACDGLPSEIVNLGESLNMTSAANILKTKAFRDLLKRSQDRLTRSHVEEFLYQMFPSEDVRECFLYCTMYPSNHRISIKGLVTSWVLEGFIDEVNSLEEAYVRGHTILKDLMDHHVLFMYDDNHVKINYLLRVREFGLMNVQALEKHSQLNENLLTIITEELTLKKGLNAVTLAHADHKREDDPDTLNLDSNSLSDVKNQHGKKIEQAGYPPSRGQRLELYEPKDSTLIVSSAMKNIETVWKWIVDVDIRTIGIIGESGSGKTWIAKHVMDRAVENASYELFIWVDLENNYYPGEIMQVQQIVPFLMSSGIMEIEEVTAELFSWQLSEGLKGKRFMMILDYAPSVHSSVLDELFSFLEPSDIRYSKILFTGSRSSIEKVPIQVDKSLNVKRFSEYDSWLLFEKITGLDVDCENIHRLVEPFLKKCNGLPSEILNLGKAAKISQPKTYFQLLHHLGDLDEDFQCQLFPSKDVRECFSYCTLYPLNHCISVKRLIMCWIFEGFFDGFGCLEEAYERGDNILKELVDCGLLFKYDDDNVGLNFLLTDRYIGLYTGGECFISKCILPGRTAQELGKYSAMNENLQIKYSADVREPLCDTSLLFLYGNESRLPHELSDLFFDEMQHLQALALFHLGISSLPVSLTNLKSLHVLMIRACDSLKSVDEIAQLYDLKVLSLSGSTSVTELPSDFFYDMNNLEYLDLSNTHLSQLPTSFSSLFNIEILILRECSLLQKVPSLEYFEKLTFLDLSGASTLREIPKVPVSLQMLDLSGSLVENIPSLRNLDQLQYLFLRDCREIKTLSPITFGRLQVLCLSGASAFREFLDSTSALWLSKDITELNLSGTQIALLPFLSGLTRLRKLVLRNCCNLKTMPSLKDIHQIGILDLSGATSFENFQDESLGNQLIYLDLSNTLIQKLPMFSAEANLVQLLLRGCKSLKQLPTLELLNLQVLDLSGSTNFSRFNDDSLEKLSCLQKLNLSATQIANLPSLSKCNHLQHIILRNCLKLKILPRVETLERLVILDLTGAAAFKQFLDDSLGKKGGLQELILSDTQVVRIPLLSECHNLFKLILRGCSKLELFPDLESLSKLEVLDLSGTHFVEFSFLSVCTSVRHLVLKDCLYIQHLPSLKELTRLVFLDLSQTNISDFSFLSGCKALCQLLLRDCPNFLNLPPLKEHTKLEVLDLSGTNIGESSFLSGCYNISQLSLRGCSNLKSLSCEGMHNLQKLDLSDTPIEVLQSTFKELGTLRQLLLEDCSSLMTLPSLEVLNQLELFDFQCTKNGDGASERTYLRFLGIQNGNYSWGFDNLKTSDRFHICLFFLDGHLKENEIYLQGHGYAFRDIYYQTYNIPLSTEEPGKFFKISGFQALPAGIEEVLSSVEFLYLKKNDFIKRLSDMGATNVKSLRDCWIESCDKMETAFCGEEKAVNVLLGRSLENLWVSKLSHLKCLFGVAVQSDSFVCLRHIYIECCPRLTTVFSSHMSLKTLDMLKIKFCDELESIVGEMGTGEERFPNLKKLILWKLPKLQTICGGVLPAIELVTVKGCPKLDGLPVMVNRTGRQSKMKAELLWWNNMKNKDEVVGSKLRFEELQT